MLSFFTKIFFLDFINPDQALSSLLFYWFAKFTSFNVLVSFVTWNCLPLSYCHFVCDLCTGIKSKSYQPENKT